MTQSNLIKFWIHDEKRNLNKTWSKEWELVCVVSYREIIKKCRPMVAVTVPSELKKFIFKELKRKLRTVEDSEDYQKFCNCRGNWVLERMGYRIDFGWSIMGLNSTRASSSGI
ncbi:hypothetical protein QJS10_CPB15g01298 [Acorus calamus]|uniref:Uncharacterized protein n=1 Tax=Acorus calamus TaxID=4465 RepID=A0AAV9D5Q4_ACOCL|nr:hypothetical protein QJS10_CPB15g01298 [Acorus calamus]